MLYEISEQEVKNILVFLKRITLSTDEALPYLQILQTLNNPVKTKIETKKETKVAKV